MRLLQGFGVAAQVLNVRTIAADSFAAQRLRQVSIYLTTAWTVSPIVGPYSALFYGRLVLIFGIACFSGMTAAYTMLLGM